MAIPLPLHSSHDLNPRSKESLLNAIATEEGRQKVVSLQDDDAEAALTLMQKVKHTSSHVIPESFD